jgi:hypothetical protein
MPSPDIRDFVDLTLYDLESQSIYLAALDYARIALPEFQPVEGSIETVVMQSVAVQVAELIRSINRLPGGVVQVLLQLFDVQRLEGASPTAMVKISGATSTSYTIPAGTRFFYQSSLDAIPFVLETDSSVVLTHQKSVSTGSLATGTMTLTTTTPHGFLVGETITMSGTDSSDFNDSFEVTSVGSLYSFSFLFAGTEPSDYSAAVATPISTHAATGYVMATGTTVTESFNGLSAGTSLDLLSVVPQIASATLATAVSGGQNTETDSQYFARASANLARANMSLVTADNYTQWALSSGSFSSIYRATTLDATDASRQSSAGSILLLVAPIDSTPTNMFDGIGDGSVEPDDADWGFKDEVRTAAVELSHPNLSVSVSDPLLVTVAVSASVKNASAKTGVEASTAIKDTLAAFISPNSWDWSPILRKNDLIARISASTDSEGDQVVSYVQSVSYSITDCHVPDGNLETQKNVTSLTMGTGDQVKVNVSSGHDLPSESTVYVAVRVPSGCTIDAGWYVYPVDGATGLPTSTQFIIEVPGWDDVNDDIAEYALLGYIDTDGNLVVSDQAPLLVSGSHEVVIV